MESNVTLPKAKTAVPEFLMGGGELGERIRNFDWSKTPLGSVDQWPQSLKTCIRIMLTSRQPIWIGWGKELIKFYNDPYKAIVGGKHPWALGTPASVVWKDIWKDIQPMLDQVMQHDQGTYVESQLLIMERNGYPEETYYTFSYTPIPGDDGKTAGMFCANTDDTERIISERQLKTLTQLGGRLTDAQNGDEVIQKTIITLKENSYDFPFAVFYTIDREYATFSAATNLGASENLLPQQIFLNEKSELSLLLQEAIVTKKMQVIDELQNRFGYLPKGAWQVHPQKAIILPIIQSSSKEPYGFLLIGCNPFRVFDAKYAGFFNLVADQVATSFAQVYALDQERKRVEALAEIDKAKTIFFSNISHEFRTPITLMLGSIEEALNDPDTISQNRERMDVAHRNAMRLLRLVNNLLDFSRIEAGKVKAYYQLTDIAKFTKELAGGFRSVIENAGLKFNVNCEYVVQPVYIDKGMWEKIVLNLLSNAFKYTLSGSIDVSITAQENQVKFKVKDTGVGIPAEELPKMFQRFHRVQNVTGRTYEGTGIGLSLISELVKLHGGEINVSSAVGEGSEFVISIPAGKDHLPQDQVADSEADYEARLSDAFIEEAASVIEHPVPTTKPAKQIHKANAQKLLVVDDNPDMRQYLSTLLGKQFNVVTANNGLDALQKLKTTEFNLIISDVMMPVMDGVEFLKNVKSESKWKNIPVIFLSARAGEESKVEGYDIGADDYLVKPFSSKELMARVRSQINIAEIRQREQQRLRQVFRQAPAAIAIFKGENFVTELANDLYLEIVDRKREELEGKPLFEAVPEAKELAEPILLKVLKTSEPFHEREFQIGLKRNGQIEQCYFNYRLEPLKENDGEITGIICIATEVTQQILARKQVEKSEKQFRDVLVQSPTIFLLLKGCPEFIITFANEPLLRSWSKGNEIIGKPLLEVLPELKGQEFPSLLENVYRSGKTYHGDEARAVLMKDGVPVEVYYTYVYQPMFDADNNVMGITVMANDVTQQVLARKKVEESEQFVRKVLENSPDCLKVLDADGRLQYMNNQGVSMTEIDDFNHVKEKYWWDFWDDATKPLVKDCVQRALNGEISQFQAFCPTAKGKPKWWDVVVSAVDPGNEQSQLIAVSRDVTASKRIEMILDGQKQALEKAVHGESLGKVLETILVNAETQSYNSLKSSILLIDKEGKHLLHGAAPSLPSAYNEAIHGIEIGPDVGSCGTAAFSGKEVVVSNIANDPLWKNFKDLALGYGLRACWSTPIFSSKGKLLGTFAMYYPEVHQPSIEEKEVVQLFSRTAGIIIEWYQDIEQRKEAEEAVLQSEEQFRTLADNIQNLAWMANGDGWIFWYNKRWFEYTGTTLDEMQGWGWQKVHHPEHIQRVLDFVKPAWQKGEPFDLTFPLRRHDGVYRWFLTRVYPVKNANNEVVRWVGTNTDIDDQKTIEEKLENLVDQRTEELQRKNIELKKSESFLQQLIDSSVEFICVIDKELKLIMVNKRVEDTMKVSRYELQGKTVFDINPAMEGSEQLKHIQQALKGKTVYLEKRPTLSRPDIYVDTYFIPLKLNDKGTDGVIIMARDVTEIVKTENLLQQKNYELQRSNEDLQQFAHVASHDLKEPVRKIRTFNRRLQDEFKEYLPDTGKTFLEKVQHSTDRMIMMIDGVLNYSKLNSTEVVIEHIDLDAMFKNIATDLEVLIQQKNASIEWKGLDNIQGASVLIYQLFYNLINNSLKFSKTTPPPVISVEGTTFWQDDKQYVQVSIADNGIGFSQENAERIFNTFTRLNSKDRYEGTGLGLALCKKIVERHHGSISAKGIKDEGAIFTVTLPVEQTELKL